MSIEMENVVGAYELAKSSDVVHDNTIAGPIYSARYPNIPVVTTNHSRSTAPTTRCYAAVVPRVLLVAISHSHASSTPLDVDAVVHHGIDVADYPFGAGDGGYVALLGRMTENKGVHRAIAIARAAGVPLKIAAKMREPHEREYFETFVEPHLGDDVEYLGEVDADGKRELLASACALLNPINWREPFGMAMLESLACGTPVVGTPQGAAPEIVETGRTGLPQRRRRRVGRQPAVGRQDRSSGLSRARGEQASRWSGWWPATSRSTNAPAAVSRRPLQRPADPASPHRPSPTHPAMR